MEIKTKFNYGDIIYVIKKEEIFDKEGRHIKWYVVETTVTFIMIAYNGEELGIRYTHNLYWETDCFSTQKQAQAECDKRNKGE